MAKISEVFYSLQGEGLYTGVPSVFIRFFGCTLQCQGFGQSNPADPKTWQQPWKNIDATRINMVEELPEDVYAYGCDSVYSWAPNFKKLQHNWTVEQLFEAIKSKIDIEYLLTGKAHIVFTGGEPLLKPTQKFIVEFLETCFNHYDRNNLYITFETNGTVELTKELEQCLTNTKEVIFSVSPKLLHTSGEPAKRAIKPDVIKTYTTHCRNHSFRYAKFVVNDSQKSLDECDSVIAYFEQNGVDFDAIYLMPEGPNKYRVGNNAQAVAEHAMKRGYRFTHRLHNILWDNKIGV